MKNVYIIHGYQAVPEDHWFGWLEQNIRQTGAHAERIFWLIRPILIQRSGKNV